MDSVSVTESLTNSFRGPAEIRTAGSGGPRALPATLVCLLHPVHEDDAGPHER